ncbi:MAG: type II toxin-antitoxin system VapC family toxin [Methanosarcinales archaeon]
MKLRDVGRPIGAIDIVVASICINRNLELITKDRDFKFIKEVEPI